MLADGPVETDFGEFGTLTRRLLGATVCIVLLVATACSSSSDDHDARPATTTTTTEPSGAVAAEDAVDWTVYGHDLANTRLSADEAQITRETVVRLEPAWSVDELVGVTGTPVVADGVTYFGDWTGTVHAVDTETGTERWATEVGGFIVGAAAVDGGAVFVSVGRTLFRLDRASGAIAWRVDVNDHELAQISASPVVVGDVVLQGVASAEVVMAKDEYTFRGSIGAYDVATGAEKWRFYTTAGDATDGPGVGVWSTPAVDVERGLLYVGSGNAYAEPTGPLADSLLAIDVETGALQWSTQFTYPDVFSGGNPGGKDADVGASPNLWSVDGRDFVGAGDKGGVYHALDRETGEIEWETTLTPGSVFGGEIGSGAFVDGRLAVVSNVGDPATNAPTNVAKVFALDPENGDILWEADEFEGLIFGPVSAVPGVAFIGTNTGKLAALDTENGDELWSFDAPDKVGGGASIVDGRVLWGYGFTLFDGPGQGGVLSFTVPGGTDASATGVTASRSPGCDAPPPAPGVSERTITADGGERKYQLTLPDDYDGRTPLPVVLGLHALTISYEFAASTVGFDQMEGAYDFVGVAPSGRLDGDSPYWFAVPARPNYDVEFIGELLDALEQELCIDPTRVFSTGMSNGAQMSSALACQLPDRIAGVAPVAGAEFYDTCADGPVAVMAFHGTEDPIVTYEGGGLNASTIAQGSYWKGDAPTGLPEHHGVEAAMKTWAAHNGCDALAVSEQVSPAVRKRTWTGCDAPTLLYTVEGAGHSWPGKPVPAFEAQFGPGTTEIDASQLLFEFFLGDH